MTIPALFAAFFCLADPYGTDSNAESLLASKPPECPEEWYLDFTRTGDRQRCGKPYGERIDHLEKLIALECKEGKGRFTAKIAEYMEAIMTEKSWTISAHDPDLTSWNGTVPHVDLGCARRGQAFCDALHYLGKSLPAETVARARENVERRMFRPYLATVHGAAIKQHWWYHTRNNWNAVCHSCVVRAALTYYPEGSTERAEILKAAVDAAPFFLDGFTDDGYCSEGAGYWNYGYGHFLLMGKALREAPEKIDLFANPKTKTIAAYGFDYRLTPWLSPRFADGGGTTAHVWLETCTSVWPDLVDGDLPVRTAFPIAQVWICRPEKFAKDGLSLGFKGGHNDEFHNHNDLGSYNIALGNTLVTGDVGAEVYTRRTFSKDRYESKVLSSYAHPVPRVDGRLQGAGRKYAAKVVKTDFTPDADTVVLDLTGGYDCPKLVRLLRHFTFDRKTGEVRITDFARFSEPASFVDPLVTLGTFEDGVITTDGASVAFDVVAKGGAWSWEDETVENPGRPSPRIHAVSFPSVTNAEVSFTFRPARGTLGARPRTKPWTYWLWQNGYGDEKTITADLEAMAELGFGGILFSDSIGYWDDDNHVVLPKRETDVMSPEWRRLVQHALRECKRLGLKFTMNVATSGGKLSGPWPVGADAPKRLMCRVYPKGAEFEKTDFPYWNEIGTYEVCAADAEELVKRGWFEAGDGTRTQEAHTTNVTVEKKWIPCVDPKAADAKRYVIRFGFTVIPGHDTDVDVLDPEAIARHFNRFVGALMDEAGADMVGEDKTFAGVYSVSWEGVVPQWTKAFREDFRKFAGCELDPFMPVLAGFVPAGVDPEKFTIDFRRVRNDMFRENFYGTLAKLAHERGVMLYSENGGPWNRDPELLKEADQLKYLSLNDMPQGEFWIKEGKGLDVFWGDRKSRFALIRGPVSAAHVYGKKRVSLESFTHMNQHYSVSPFTLKSAIDMCFADGANHVVWHTFTMSPDVFGVPGIEYFAGTHVNRNVTWHSEAKAFVDYLARCETVLQAGEPVVDIAVKAGKTPYAHWGRFRDATPDGVKIPDGYNYDLVDDEEWEKSTVKDGWRVMASGMKYPAELPAKPDLEGPFAFCHRRTATEDIYFLQGDAKAEAVFRVSGRNAVLFDAVSGEIKPLATKATDDGRTAVALDLSETGSAIVVFGDGFAAVGPASGSDSDLRPWEVKGPWSVSFAYHRLDHTRHLPAARTMERLSDWTTSDDADLRHFSGTATYRTVFVTPRRFSENATLSLGALPSGVAHVSVNGVDCGTVWCAPWTVKIPDGTIRSGENTVEIRYVNNWQNRLIGDAGLPEADRVTTSCLQLTEKRIKPNGKKLNVFSGYCTEDELQPSGLLGPVKIVFR